MKVNGAFIEFKESQTLYDFLLYQQYDLTKIAVELNGRIISRSAYKEILLNNNDTLEVVQFVGGG